MGGSGFLIQVPRRPALPACPPPKRLHHETREWALFDSPQNALSSPGLRRIPDHTRAAEYFTYRMPSPVASAMTGGIAPPVSLQLTDLPPELLTQVCAHLCLHCRTRFVVNAPSKDVEACRDDERALARLSRTSRYLQDVAQPVLFHYYYTRDVKFYDEFRTERLWKEHKLMESFLCAIARRPDLRRAVRALALTVSSKLGVILDEGVAPANRPAFVEAARTIGIQGLGWQQSLSLNWMQDAAILLATSVDQLLFHRERFVEVTPDIQLPSLKYVVVPGDRGPFRRRAGVYLRKCRDILARAPNLERLNAPGCLSNEYGFVNRRKMWDIPLGRLKSLSLNGLAPAQFHAMLRFCPVLEDLEYHPERRNDGPWLLDQAQLAPVSAALRRFCYGAAWEKWCLDRQRASPQEILDRATARMSDADGLDFAEFAVLEILEIDQMLLYGRAFGYGRAEREEVCRNTQHSAPEAFVAKLPPSLKILHISMVVAPPELCRDLRGLSRNLSRLPSLKIVRIGPYGQMDQDQVEELTTLFASVGIRFQYGRVMPRCTIPARF